MIAQALSIPLFTKRSASATTVGGVNPITSWLSHFGLTAGSATSATQKTALTLSAFYNGINIICNDYAKLPKGVFQKVDDQIIKHTTHPLRYLINKRPNQYMNRFMFDSMLIQDAILKGNGYAVIDRNANAQPTALQYINQDETPVEVVKHENQLYYKIKGYASAIHSDNIIHIPGFSFNGITGIGVVTHAANSLGVNLSSQKYASEYYDQKSLGTGVITTDKVLDIDQKERYSDGFTKMLSKKQAYTVPVIDGGMSFTPIKVTAQEAQFLLANENGINEVARWLNINPSKLKHNKDINNSISESLNREHVQDSILPWAIKGEQEYDVKLFTQAEKHNNYYIKFNTNSLLSADKVAQADYWSKLIYAGVLTINNVRALLEMNPVNGGDVIRTPVNSQTEDQVQKNIDNIKKQITDVKE